MKFCLWIPPRRFLELADEMGMLVWLEYPTWHPQLDKEHLPDLQQEFGEFFQYDRVHPSAMLRSLTCETGPSADIQVIQSLYDRAASRNPRSARRGRFELDHLESRSRFLRRSFVWKQSHLGCLR